jgi:hypothetical protein
VRIDRRNGKRITCDQTIAGVGEEWIPPDRMPLPAMPNDYDESGRAWLTTAYTSWHESSYNERRHELALNPSASQFEQLQVISPADGTQFLLDPEIPSGSDRLRPMTNLPGVARWSSPTLHIEPSSPEPIVHLAPGSHTLIATDPRDGSVQSITLHVRQL